MGSATSLAIGPLKRLKPIPSVKLPMNEANVYHELQGLLFEKKANQTCMQRTLEIQYLKNPHIWSKQK